MDMQGLYVLMLALMVAVTLLGAMVNLPRAWPRLDAPRRAVSLALLAAMLAVTVCSLDAGWHASTGVRGGLATAFAALIFWAFELCEWELRKSIASDPAARHERRVHGGSAGVAMLLIGDAAAAPRPAHAAWLPLLAMAVGFALGAGWWIPRLRAALLRRF